VAPVQRQRDLLFPNGLATTDGDVEGRLSPTILEIGSTSWNARLDCNEAINRPATKEQSELFQFEAKAQFRSRSLRFMKLRVARLYCDQTRRS
jgi:hypothetical protein